MKLTIYERRVVETDVPDGLSDETCAILLKEFADKGLIQAKSVPFDIRCVENKEDGSRRKVATYVFKPEIKNTIRETDKAVKPFRIVADPDNPNLETVLQLVNEANKYGCVDDLRTSGKHMNNVVKCSNCNSWFEAKVTAKFEKDISVPAIMKDGVLNLNWEKTNIIKSLCCYCPVCGNTVASSLAELEKLLATK